MAYDWQKDWLILRKQENSLVASIQKQYKVFIKTLSLIAQDKTMSKQLKIEQTRNVIYQIELYNKDFSQNLNKVYLENVKKGYIAIGELPQEPTTEQLKEMQLLQENLLTELNSKTTQLEQKAVAIVGQAEIAKIRTEMGMKTPIINPDYSFKSNSGRMLSVDGYLNFVVGNQVNETQLSARFSTYVLNGRTIGTFVAVLDDRTTPVCRSLNGQIVDLTKDSDKIPPIAGHRCRSFIRIDPTS